jgi:tRNA-dependent cyclodipeptide synthase
MEVISNFGLAKNITDTKNYNCILGISVGSRDFSKEHIKRYLKWCLTNFNKVLIVMVDEIKKYNWMAFENLTEASAREKALYEGAEMFNGVNKVIRALRSENFDTSKISVVRWLDVINMVPEYESTTKLLETFFAKNEVFRNDALKMTEKYAESRKLNLITNSQKKLAVNFLLKEISLFILLGKSTADCYCIDIYPGKFFIMENIFENKYDGLLNMLPKGIVYGHIEIGKKKKLEKN